MSAEDGGDGIALLGTSNTRRMKKWLTALALFYDLFMVVISVADVVLVVVTVYADARLSTMWLPLMMVGTCFYAFVCAAFATDYGLGASHKWYPPAFVNCCLPIPNFIKFFFFLTIAPILPGVHWALIRFGVTTVPPADPPPITATRAAQQESEAVERSSFIMGIIAAALEGQKHSHALLFLESGLHAAPQAAVILLGRSFFDTKETTLQTITLSCTMLSVVTKAYYVCFSCHAGPFAAKVLLAVFDFFSVCYFFAVCTEDLFPSFSRSETLLQHMQDPWGLSRGLSWGIVVGASVVAVCIVGVHRRGDLCMIFFCNALPIVSGILPFVFPAALMLFARPSLILLLLRFYFEPPYEFGVRNVATLFAFVQHNSGWLALGDNNPWRSKIKHLYYDAARIHVSTTNPSTRWTTVTQHIIGWRRRDIVSSLECERLCRMNVLPGRMGSKAFSHRNLLKCFWYTAAITQQDGSFTNADALRMVLSPYLTASIFTILFPFLSFALNTRNVTPFGVYCFVGLSASFAAFCLLLPAALRYIGFAIEIAYVLDATSRIDATASMPQEQRTAAWVGAALTPLPLARRVHRPDTGSPLWN